MVDPAARLLEIVTGADVRRDLTDAEVELAVLQMQSSFADRRPGRRPDARHHTCSPSTPRRSTLHAALSR